MTNVHVTSFTELHQALERCRDNSPWIFRGQSNPLWKLVPKAGRPPFDRIEDDAILARADLCCPTELLTNPAPNVSSPWKQSCGFLPPGRVLATVETKLHRNKFRARKITFAGRSASRRMKYGYQAVP